MHSLPNLEWGCFIDVTLYEKEKGNLYKENYDFFFTIFKNWNIISMVIYKKKKKNKAISKLLR